MKFVKEVTGEKMAIPAAALKLCGFENGDKAELHALPSAAIILKQKMTAIWSLWEECTDGQTQKEDGIYQLISNAENEMKEYAHKVKQLSADKIYQHSAETAAKENLLCSIIHDSYDLDDADLAKILQQEEPLDTLYQFLLGGKTDLSSESSISSILNEYNAQCQEETATMDTGVTLC